MLVQGIVMNVIKEKRGGKIRAGRRCNNETRREEKKSFNLRRYTYFRL